METRFIGNFLFIYHIVQQRIQTRGIIRCAAHCAFICALIFLRVWNIQQNFSLQFYLMQFYRKYKIYSRINSMLGAYIVRIKESRVRITSRENFLKFSKNSIFFVLTHTPNACNFIACNFILEIKYTRAQHSSELPFRGPIAVQAPAIHSLGKNAYSSLFLCDVSPSGLRSDVGFRLLVDNFYFQQPEKTNQSKSSLTHYNYNIVFALLNF